MHLNYYLGIRPKWLFLSPKSPNLLWGCGFDPWDPQIYSSVQFHFYNFLVFSLSPTVLFVLQICINLYYIIFLFPSNLLTIVQLFSHI